MANGKEVRDDLKYSTEHEWVKVMGDGTILCGLTDYAQNNLGDIVFVELSVKEGNVALGDTVAVVESAKAASDVYAPVSGEIIEVNTAVEDAPEMINESPYDDAWLFKLILSNEAELSKLMGAEQYMEFIADAD